ncbi:hypothetical protein WKW50_24900 [Ochrobactrum sp. GPK 3]
MMVDFTQCANDRGDRCKIIAKVGQTGSLRAMIPDRSGGGTDSRATLPVATCQFDFPVRHL